MRISRKSMTAIALVTGGACLLAACSSSPTKTTIPPQKRQKGSSTTTTTRPSTHPSTTTSAPTSTSTTVATANSTCQVEQLHIVQAGALGAAGTQELTYSLTSTGTSTCTLYGYPGMALLGASGQHLRTTVERGGTLSFEDISPSTVHLSQGQTAYFNVGYSDVPTGTTTCSNAHAVEITPPTNTTHVTVTAPLGILACDNGTLHVSAVFGSTDAAATQTTAPAQTG